MEITLSVGDLGASHFRSSSSPSDVNRHSYDGLYNEKREFFLVLIMSGCQPSLFEPLFLIMSGPFWMESPINEYRCSSSSSRTPPPPLEPLSDGVLINEVPMVSRGESYSDKIQNPIQSNPN